MYNKLARADISCQFMKTRSLCRHCLQNEWTLVICIFGKLFILWKKQSFLLCYFRTLSQVISFSGYLFGNIKFGYSEQATKFEKIFHLKFDATQ